MTRPFQSSRRRRELNFSIPSQTMLGANPTPIKRAPNVFYEPFLSPHPSSPKYDNLRSECRFNSFLVVFGGGACKAERVYIMFLSDGHFSQFAVLTDRQRIVLTQASQMLHRQARHPIPAGEADPAQRQQSPQYPSCAPES